VDEHAVCQQTVQVPQTAEDRTSLVDAAFQLVAGMRRGTETA
jgi:hypothetical protein